MVPGPHLPAPVLYAFIWQDHVFHPSLITTLRFQNFSTFPRWFSSRWTSESFTKFKETLTGAVGIRSHLLYISGEVTSSHNRASSSLKMWWFLQWLKSIHLGSLALDCVSYINPYCILNILDILYMYFLIFLAIFNGIILHCFNDCCHIGNYQFAEFGN